MSGRDIVASHGGGVQSEEEGGYIYSERIQGCVITYKVLVYEDARVG